MPIHTTNRKLAFRPSGCGLRRILSWALMLAAMQPAGIAASQQRPPNILFVLADDLGYMDVNAFAERLTGAPATAQYYETPHLDRLAHEGFAFSQARAFQLCSPSRAAILTGRNPARIGLVTATGQGVKTWYNQGMEPPAGQHRQDAIFWRDAITHPQATVNGTSLVALPSGQAADGGNNEVTFAEALPNYHSAFIGKWHVGGHGATGWQPADQGFQEIAYYDSGASPYFKWRARWDDRAKPFPQMPQTELTIGRSGAETNEDFLTADLTEQAIRYLRARAADPSGKPFLLYFCQFSIHGPWQAPSELVEHFTKKNTRGWNGHENPIYAAMVKALDDSVGRLRTALEQTGLADNTWIVFASDNGGVNWGANRTNNAPLKGGKATLYEGGLRVPLIFWTKKSPAPGQWSDVPVSLDDLWPTIVELGGRKSSVADARIDGRSLHPLFADPTNRRGAYERDTYYWHYPFNVKIPHPDDGHPPAPHSAVLVKNLKLIFDWSGEVRLYDLSTDRGEATNLAEARPADTRRMFRQLHDWLDANVAPHYLPTRNPEFRVETDPRRRPFRDLRAEWLGPSRALATAKPE